MPLTVTFDAELWLAKADNPWVFVTLPEVVSDEIEATVATKGGFGSVKVHASIGRTTWSTSLFPDKSRRAYILPIKKAVRTEESIDVGDSVTVSLLMTHDS